MHTDASNYALGSVLLQDGHPVAYASRTLNSHEVRYSTTEKELLAVVWSVKYFRPYIYGKEFTLHTDHQALKWLHTKFVGQDLNQRLSRWILSLGEYNMKVEYIKGKDNVIADFLSRINSESHEIVGTTETVDNNEGRETQPQLNKYSELDTVVNRFHNQIIIEDNQTNHCENINGKIRLYINPDSNENEILNIFNNSISDKKVAIYSIISCEAFNVIKNLFLTKFPEINFIKCKFFAQDVQDEDQLIRIISIQHEEQGHSGIVALYEHLNQSLPYGFEIDNK